MSDEYMTTHPKYYTDSNVELEIIDVIRHAPFPLGSMIKYMIRFPSKGEHPEEDLTKAYDYLKWSEQDTDFNSEPYDTFLQHHGQYLKKFERFKNWNPESCFLDYCKKILYKLAKNYDSLSE